jgi:CubicO group peptidase (beta-lactamase class C family)
MSNDSVVKGPDLGNDFVKDMKAAIKETLSRGEIGVQVAVHHKGKLVVDAWGGSVNLAGKPVVETTIFPAASTGKAATGLALHLQVDRGIIGYDDLVGSVWPEFACKGKEKATIRHVVTHSVGLPKVPPGWTREKEGEGNWMADSLAAMEAMYPPGTKNAYHAHTWGFLIAEIVRRADPKGRPFPQIQREEALLPYGITDYWCQMPPEEFPRLATQSGTRSIDPNDPQPKTIEESHVRNKPGYWDIANPSAAVMSARSGGRLMGMYAHGGEIDGMRVLPEKTVRSFLTPKPNAGDPDILTGKVKRVGLGGLVLRDSLLWGEDFGENILWQSGIGGSYGWADLDNDLSVMLCHNKMFLPEQFTKESNPWTPIVNVISREFVTRR